MTGIIESICNEVADFFINIVADKTITDLLDEKEIKGRRQYEIRCTVRYPQ